MYHCSEGAGVMVARWYSRSRVETGLPWVWLDCKLHGAVPAPRHQDLKWPEAISLDEPQELGLRAGGDAQLPF